MKFHPPYWFHTDIDDSPLSTFNDFNKEIIEAGVSKKLPNGAVGIRVDSDFWAVAFLPLEFKSKTVQEIVLELWPELHAQATI
jgi:hypothetical protein